MANIRIDLNGALTDGMTVTFKAPCNCSEITGLKIYYVKDGDLVGESFTMKDALVNNLANTDNLFAAGAYVTAVLDTVNKRAYLQNASSSEYLEGKVTPVNNLTSTSTTLPLSAAQGKKLKDDIDSKLNVTKTDVYLRSTDASNTEKSRIGGVMYENNPMVGYMHDNASGKTVDSVGILFDGTNFYATGNKGGADTVLKKLGEPTIATGGNASSYTIPSNGKAIIFYTASFYNYQGSTHSGNNGSYTVKLGSTTLDSGSQSTPNSKDGFGFNGIWTGDVTKGQVVSLTTSVGGWIRATNVYIRVAMLT